MRTAVIIPARLGSERLPGKPLLTLGQLPLVIHVYNQVSLCNGIDDVCIATDSGEIMEICDIREGKTVGRIKKAIEEAILDGKIDNDHEKALDYLYQIKDDYIS